MKASSASVSAWTEQYDEGYNAKYWFNAKTGESTWVKPEGFGVNIYSTDTSTLSAGTGNDKDKGGTSISNSDGTAVEEGDTDTTSLLHSSTSVQTHAHARANTHTSINLILNTERVRADTEAAMKSFSRTIYFTAMFIECPMALLETCLRIGLFLLSAIICGALAIFRYQNRRAYYTVLGRDCVRETLLCLAALFSLLIPGLVCTIYRQYHTYDDWDLAPLPTVLGWVDSRRFASFVFGSGRFTQISTSINTGADAGTSTGLAVSTQDKTFEWREGGGTVAVTRSHYSNSHDTSSDVNDVNTDNDNKQTNLENANATVTPTSTATIEGITDVVVERLLDLHLSAAFNQDYWKTGGCLPLRLPFCHSQKQGRGNDEGRVDLTATGTGTGAILLYPRKVYARFKELLNGRGEMALATSLQCSQKQGQGLVSGRSKKQVRIRV